MGAAGNGKLDAERAREAGRRSGIARRRLRVERDTRYAARLLAFGFLASG
jgi:hypothetical protein